MRLLWPLAKAYAAIRVLDSSELCTTCPLGRWLKCE
jgi:hypothetical protein